MSMIDMQETGNRIKTYMKKVGMTTSDVQKELNLAGGESVRRWIHGKHLPTIDNLVVLSELFDCKIDDLIVVK